jgi:DNA repair protein RadC
MPPQRPENLLKVPLISLRIIREKNAWFSKTVTNPLAVVEMVYPFLKNLDREKVIVIGLDIKNKPTLINVVCIGSINCAAVSPRNVFAPLILSNAASFLICHNHVTGDVQPSQADIETTKTLREVGKMLQIQLVDHLIIGEEMKFYSFANEYLKNENP